MRRKKMTTKNDYINFVQSHNNRTNVYTTVYDFEYFTEKMPVEASVIIDRIFLDFDAHEDELDKAWRDVKKVMEMIIVNNYQHTLFFSGRGFHLFLFGEITKNMRDVQTFFKEIKEFLEGTTTLIGTNFQQNNTDTMQQNLELYPFTKQRKIKNLESHW